MAEPDVRRIVEVDHSEVEPNLNVWRSTIGLHFPELLFPAEVALSIMAQILIQDITNPFALVLVDVPASGKTITINFFSGIKELTYATDKFTPSSFVSNAANVKKEELNKVDLLPRIRYKMFLIRDLATLFSKRDDDLNESLGILTRALDGEGLLTDTGVHGGRGYTGEYLFMLLAASTPIPHKIWRMMGSLGSRLFFLHLHTKEKTEKQLAEQVTNHSHKEKENACREMTKGFLYSLWSKYPEGVKWDKNADPEDLRIIISRCAKLLAKLRGVIKIWRENDNKEYEYSEPIVEKPDRINQLLYNLSRGHALICGRTNITLEDLKPVVEVVMDSAPPSRARLLRRLLESKGIMTTQDVMDCLGVSAPTALKEMEILKLLGLCDLVENKQYLINDRQNMIQIKEDYAWFFSEQFQEIWHGTHSQEELIIKQN